jgi:hypothetical protein
MRAAAVGSIVTVVSPTQWYRKFIADLATQHPRLRKAQMVGISGTVATNKARLFGDRFDVIAVAYPALRRQGQYGFVDGKLTPSLALCRTRTWRFNLCCFRRFRIRLVVKDDPISISLMPIDGAKPAAAVDAGAAAVTPTPAAKPHHHYTPKAPDDSADTPASDEIE